MKKILFFAMLAVVGIAAEAQFVKTYKAIPGCFSQGGSLTFNCIDKARTGSNFFIAGMQDSSVYVAEVDPNGIIVREKLIGTNLPCLLPHTMIVDRDNNLVIIGDSKKTASGNLYGFIMKVSPALSLIFEKDYFAFSNSQTLSLSDVKENGNYYYVCGTTILPTITNRNYDVLLMRVDRNTGGITTLANDIYSGQPGINSGFDSYDALSLNTDDEGTLNGISTTGRIGNRGRVRAWITQHNVTDLNFTQGKRYIKDLNSSAAIYSNSLLRDVNNLLTCWGGSLTTNSRYEHIGLISVDNATLNPVFMKQYFITSPQPQSELLLRRVRKDITNGGYANEGFYFARGTDNCGRQLPGSLFFLKVDNTGSPVWGKQFKDILVSFYSHNSEFVVDGNFIYAVGYKKNASGNGNYNGALIKIPASNGAMDTACAFSLAIDQTSLDYNATDSLQRLDMLIPYPSNSYPVNCLQTERTEECVGCGKFIRLDANFQLAGQTVTGSPNFIATASAFSISPNSKWKVSEIDASGNDITGTSYTSLAGGFWGTTSPSTFKGYFGNEGFSYPDGVFLQGSISTPHKYKFIHYLSLTNRCALTISDTAVKKISICSTCKTGSGFIIEAGNSMMNKELNTNQAVYKENNLVKVYPNPANTRITFNFAEKKQPNTEIQITNAKGQVLKTEKTTNTQYSLNTSAWIAGSYFYSIINNGNIIDKGSFIIQH